MNPLKALLAAAFIIGGLLVTPALAGKAGPWATQRWVVLESAEALIRVPSRTMQAAVVKAADNTILDPLSISFGKVYVVLLHERRENRWFAGLALEISGGFFDAVTGRAWPDIHHRKALALLPLPGSPLGQVVGEYVLLP
jgi:hypothetical protein